MDIAKEWKSYLFGGIGLAAIGLFMFIMDLITQSGGMGMFNLTIGQMGFLFLVGGVILAILGVIYKPKD